MLRMQVRYTWGLLSVGIVKSTPVHNLGIVRFKAGLVSLLKNLSPIDITEQRMVLDLLNAFRFEPFLRIVIEELDREILGNRRNAICNPPNSSSSLHRTHTTLFLIPRAWTSAVQEQLLSWLSSDVRSEMIL